MSADLSLQSRRLRLLLMSGPGLFVILAAVVSFLYSLRFPEFDFGKRKLLTYAVIGFALAGTGALVHRKGVNDYRKSGRGYWKTVIFVIASVVLVPSLVVLAFDQAVGVVLRQTPAPPLLIFPPRCRVSYSTPEFEFTAETNGIGIRDREVELPKKDRFRVLAIGDSYTYGWGVDAADAWPGVVKQKLTEKGREVEVLNLGCPGTSVDAYAVIAERAIPLLNPDLVLVAVLQGDDIKQLDLGETTDRLSKFNGVQSDEPSGEVMARVLPNLNEFRLRLAARRPQVVTADRIREEWQRLAHWIQGHLSPEETRRLEAADEEVKARLFAGNLNPWDVYFALKHPDYMDFTLHPDHADVQRAVDVMASSLERIKAAAEHSSTRVTAVSVPAACYTCAKGLASRRRIGFHLDDEALRSDAPDEVIRSACRKAGIEFHTFMDRFRKIADDRDLYFEFDGHFNRQGHLLFAEQVAELLQYRE